MRTELRTSEPPQDSDPEELDVADVPAEVPTPTAGDRSKAPPFTHTRLSASWAAVVVGLVVLLILLIFILENGQHVSVAFLGTHSRLPEGVALLFAAVIGGLTVVFVGAGRILQLRTRALKNTRAASKAARRSRNAAH
jgi:uncharacterized integral membrane protein